ncbi:uncharacterized protein B0T23DRAFT_431759 [Neurospora hispaniola]|uniref:Uncharacterized protein n=1 Tax=Neurospora hispaniola TaxID=588809 RepID=A0AAJ0MNS6_9PEZI|nr:hypothetical protein B0T23DRAFT_431759 [Neurospora hispaniola]
MSDKPSTGTKADMSSGSGTNTGPSTGAAASDTRDKPVATKPAQTCDCGHTGSCTCTPGDCACENCPYLPSSSSTKKSKAAAPGTTDEEEEWTVV